MTFVTKQEQFKRIMGLWRDIIDSQESCWEETRKKNCQPTFGEYSQKPRGQGRNKS